MSALTRAARAEAVRIGGRRGAVVALLTLAVALPLAVTFAVAALAEHVADVATSVNVTAVSTTNAAYWVLALTPVASCAVAAYAAAGAPRGPSGPWDRFLTPSRPVAAAARWLIFGGFGAAATAGLTALVLVALPACFERVYAEVSLTSGAGVRLFLVGGATSFLLCGAAIGVARMIGHPVAALVAVLGWAQIVEPGIALVPGAANAQRYLPFLNAVYASGQELVFAPPWSPNGAIGYVAALCVTVFAFGIIPIGRAATPRSPRSRRRAAPHRRSVTTAE